MNRFTRSWLLFKTSLAIMAGNKKLVAFPIVTFFLTILIVLFFLAPVALRPTGDSYGSSQHWRTITQSLFVQTTDANGHVTHSGLSPVAVFYLAVMYFVSMFLATFFNVAFYHEIFAALSGETVSIKRGLQFATTRWKAIFLWAVFAGAVGLLIRQIEERMGLVGRIIGRFIGIAWSVASVFVVPLIVADEQNVNPVSTLKNSAGILRKTWGEGLIGYVGVNLFNGLVFLAALIVLAGAIIVSATSHNYWLIGVVAPVWLLLVVSLSYLSSVASQIYKGALFLYAANGVAPEPYSQEMLDSAWKFKKQ
ncbi:MAG TPA: DUF6159 family protein [Verrucomicrobiae bacterium]|nr:DUF6159 family protein [Verrucomicrobiae bacterium]